MKVLEKIEKYLSEKEMTAYQKFFQEKLKEFGANSPADLDADKKKEFFDMIEKEWKGEKK